MTARAITCEKCGQVGGTLERVSENKYQHRVCPQVPISVKKSSPLVLASPRLITLDELRSKTMERS